MSQLFDKLFTEPWRPLFNIRAAQEPEHERHMPDLKRATRFEISNVYQHLLEHRPQAKKDIRDFVVCAPMFPTMWFEYQADRIGHFASDRQTIEYDERLDMRTVGWLLRSHDLETDEARAEAAEWLIGRGGIDHMPAEARWIVQADDWAYQEFRDLSDDTIKHVTMGPNFGVALLLDHNGMILWHTVGPYYNREEWDLNKLPKLKDDDYMDAMSKLTPVLFALTFMHCRNVEHVDVKPKRTPSRQHQRKHGTPLSTYKVLKINVTKSVKVGVHTESGSGTPMPLHICRGHFRLYMENAPLFGSYVGPVWVPAHVRGTAKAGSFTHDYEVVT